MRHVCCLDCDLAGSVRSSDPPSFTSIALRLGLIPPVAVFLFLVGLFEAIDDLLAP
jgi:hypothetical protein